MWILMLVALLLGAQLNLTALVPAAAEQAPPPWWVGGRLIWPFGLDTTPLLHGDALATATPLLAITSAVLFAAAAAALLHWVVPAAWFPYLIVAAAVCSVALQVIWISPWAIVPLALDAALLWAVFGAHVSVAGLRG